MMLKLWWDEYDLDDIDSVEVYTGGFFGNHKKTIKIPASDITKDTHNRMVCEVKGLPTKKSLTVEVRAVSKNGKKGPWSKHIKAKIGKGGDDYSTDTTDNETTSDGNNDAEGEVASLARPENFVARTAGAIVKLYWDPVDGAQVYQLQRTKKDPIEKGIKTKEGKVKSWGFEKVAGGNIYPPQGESTRKAVDDKDAYQNAGIDPNLGVPKVVPRQFYYYVRAARKTGDQWEFSPWATCKNDDADVPILRDVIINDQDENTILDNTVSNGESSKVKVIGDYMKGVQIAGLHRMTGNGITDSISIMSKRFAKTAWDTLFSGGTLKVNHFDDVYLFKIHGTDKDSFEFDIPPGLPVGKYLLFAKSHGIPGVNRAIINVEDHTKQFEVRAIKPTTVVAGAGPQLVRIEGSGMRRIIRAKGAFWTSVGAGVGVGAAAITGPYLVAFKQLVWSVISNQYFIGGAVGAAAGLRIANGSAFLREVAYKWNQIFAKGGYVIPIPRPIPKRFYGNSYPKWLMPISFRTSFDRANSNPVFVDVIQDSDFLLNPLLFKVTQDEQGATVEKNVQIALAGYRTGRIKNPNAPFTNDGLNLAIDVDVSGTPPKKAHIFVYTQRERKGFYIGKIEIDSSGKVLKGTITVKPSAKYNTPGGVAIKTEVKGE